MNKYVVGYLSFFDNEVLLEVIEAESKLKALLAYLDLSEENFPDEKSVHDFCAEGDSSISVLQINNLPRSGRSGGDLQNRVAGLDSLSAIH